MDIGIGDHVCRETGMAAEQLADMVARAADRFDRPGVTRVPLVNAVTGAQVVCYVRVAWVNKGWRYDVGTYADMYDLGMTDVCDVLDKMASEDAAGSTDKDKEETK
jgi:hypothetical protein